MSWITWPTFDDLLWVAVETRYVKATDTGGSRYQARRVWHGEEWHSVATDYTRGAGVEQYRRAAEALTGGPVFLIGETEDGPLFMYQSEEEEKSEH